MISLWGAEDHPPKRGWQRSANQLIGTYCSLWGRMTTVFRCHDYPQIQLSNRSLKLSASSHSMQNPQRSIARLKSCLANPDADPTEKVIRIRRKTSIKRNQTPSIPSHKFQIKGSPFMPHHHPYPADAASLLDYSTTQYASTVSSPPSPSSALSSSSSSSST